MVNMASSHPEMENRKGYPMVSPVGKLEHVSGDAVFEKIWSIVWRGSLFSDKPHESVRDIPSKEWLILKCCCVYTS